MEVGDSTQNELTATSYQGQINAQSVLRLLIEKYESILWNRKPMSPDRR